MPWPMGWSSTSNCRSEEVGYQHVHNNDQRIYPSRYFSSIHAIINIRRNPLPPAGQPDWVQIDCSLFEIETAQTARRRAVWAVYRPGCCWKPTSDSRMGTLYLVIWSIIYHITIDIPLITITQFAPNVKTLWGQYNTRLGKQYDYSITIRRKVD